MYILFHCIGSGKLNTFYVGLFILLRICLESAVDGIVKRDHLLSGTFLWYCLSRCTSGSNFESVDQFILKCDSFN